MRPPGNILEELYLPVDLEGQKAIDGASVRAATSWNCLSALLVPDKLSSSREIEILKRAILCECGEFVRGHTFKDYIPTSISPSTPTFGHSGCGLIFDLVDGELPRSFSTRIQLKSIAMRFAKMNKMEDGSACLFLLEVDRLKSRGNVCDMDILITAHKTVQERTSAAVGE